MDILDGYLADVAPLIDTERIVRRIVELGQIERNTDFDSFARSADYVNRCFQSMGVASRILHFPADGKTKLQCWTAPIGYRTTRAVCAIVEPHTSARVLGDRDVEPNTAIVGTGYTGPQGIEAPVVHVKKDMDLPGVDLAGKIVYCSDLNPFSIRRRVIEGGGRAVVSSFTERREENYCYVKWVNTWDAETDGWLPTARAREENLPGISISPEMGDYLEQCLAQGPVRLRVVTEGEYVASEFLGVSAAIEGQEDSMVLLTGHLFEQGLTDNAAGAILGLTVSEVIQALVRRPNAPPLRRSLGNFHSQECYGVMALRQYHPQIPARAFAHLNIDMIGVADPPVGLLPGLLVSTGPGGFLLRLILDRARALAPGGRYEIAHRLDINCTLLADPLLGGVPTTQLEQLNPTWHTSRDRAGVQELDRDTIRFTALAAAAWACYLVAGGDEEAEWLLGEYIADVERALDGGDVPDTQIYLQLKRQEMSGLAVLVSPGKRARFLDTVHGWIADVEQRLGAGRAIVPPGSDRERRQSRELYPRALLGGPAVDACFTPEQLAQIGRPKWSAEQWVLKSWADGSRSIYDIARLATFETGVPFTLGDVLTLFEHYARQGIVSLDRDR